MGCCMRLRERASICGKGGLGGRVGLEVLEGGHRRAGGGVRWVNGCEADALDVERGRTIKIEHCSAIAPPTLI